MYQSTLLTNVNAKRINQPTNTSRAIEAYEEPEFSYNDVLHEELSRSLKQRKRKTSNNNANNLNSNPSSSKSFVDNFKLSSQMNHFKNFIICAVRPRPLGLGM